MRRRNFLLGGLGRLFGERVTALAAGDAADIAVVALSIEAAGVDGEPHQWVRLIPMGAFGGQRDVRGPWLLDGSQHAAEVVAASLNRASGQDLVVDYDHQSEAALSVQRASAPASGWMKDLQARADGIYAKIEWTEPAKAKLKAKEYRYISPVFGYEAAKADGKSHRVKRLLRAGLTNNPCLPELAAVASVAPHSQTETDMDLKKVAKALGLPETATEAEVEAALAALPALGAGASKIAIAAGLAPTANPDEVVVAVGKLKADLTAAGAPDPGKFVPRETFDALSLQVTKLGAGLVEEKAIAAVDAAIEGGKVAPANRDWALGYAKQDLTGFQTFVGAQPAILVKGRQLPAGGKAPEVTADDEEIAVAASLGLTSQEYLESKKALRR